MHNRAINNMKMETKYCQAKFIQVRILFFKSHIIQVREIDDMGLAYPKRPCLFNAGK